MNNERTPLVTCIKHIVLTKNVLQIVVGENTTCRKFLFDKHSSEVYIQQLG